MDDLAQTRAVFTGDTLFVGDVGRPDLREADGEPAYQREHLAAQLYDSTRRKLMTLPPTTRVYPAHGPGSLCGKTTSPDLDSTIAKELKTNYALQPMSEEDFVKAVLEDQPFVPRYFAYDVALNQLGAPSFEDGVRGAPRLQSDEPLAPGVLIIDTRPAAQFKAGHLASSINLQEGSKFETWLGSVVGPQEPFYLVADSRIALDTVIRKAAKIGYETNIQGALLTPSILPDVSLHPPVAELRAQPAAFTIVDVRNRTEAEQALFPGAHLIPLPELRERAGEIPRDKPVIVHCASGYRSAAGASILVPLLPGTAVYDLGNNYEL